ncbi:chemoreceptor glutamine deamidase CheD [Zhongshania arctica]|uniref:Probable chemoreceptor glutamine deamidase CheD n=1 Tax=Zhongshania arctica TaxID=3238302 RepID=A0ABV3TVT1_9GAMM
MMRRAKTPSYSKDEVVPQAQSKLNANYPDIQKHWDGAHEVYAARVLPGQYYVSGSEQEMITTVLGSCISACIRERVLKIGGMNHFMLPEGDAKMDGMAARYGAYAMEHLINDILKVGGRRENLEVKIFGGGRMMRGLNDIGKKNISFVRAFLELEQIDIVAEDVGLDFSRKIYYFPTTGRVLVKRLRSLHANMVIHEEEVYERTLHDKPVSNDIELFD